MAIKTSEVVYFGITYALIFTGYYVSNGFLTILYPNETFISFAIFYGVYAIGSLFSPFIYDKINLKWSLVVSAFTFLIYIGLMSSSISVLMLIGSGICGAGNAIIWLAQGHWMSTFPNDERKATLIGLFFGIFYANGVVGNTLGIIVLVSSSSSVRIMIWIMIGVTGVGFVMTFFISVSHSNNDRGVEEHKSLLETMKDIFLMIRIKSGYLLIPLFLAQALGLNVTYQTMTNLIVINGNNNGQDENIYTAAIFIVYGGLAMMSSIVCGKIYDKFRWIPLVLSYIILELGCLIGILMLGLFSDRGPLGLWIIVGFVRGITDVTINTIINVSIAETYEGDESKSYYALYRFIYAVSYAVFSVATKYIPYPYFLLVSGMISVTSVIFYSFFPKPPKTDLSKIKRVENKKRIEQLK